MKCPKCGKEIANDSQFCEFCGTQVKAMPHQVNSGLVAWIMFLLVICFSAAAMSCIECLNHTEMEYASYVAHCTVINTFLLITFANLSVFVISIVLAVKKQFRKSTSITLCLMSAFIALGAIITTSTLEVGILPYRTEAEGIIMNDSFIYASIMLAAIVAGIYAIYWLVAKVKHINF